MNKLPEEEYAEEEEEGSFLAALLGLLGAIGTILLFILTLWLVMPWISEASEYSERKAKEFFRSEVYR